ncbi:CPBP family intramembrane glutamic endopeptidase [Mycoplasmopsis opalescens]|uniref:CPBP family intramembrane glutamic endopeptidase n=1 Tax=Mycoplasmopsis opalescens TaxID=114886 RepID=UPI0004A738AC|nr:CPBP family intramembrane glutamic endopeptidase [Mycoplasmopsis opalescens]
MPNFDQNLNNQLSNFLEKWLKFGNSAWATMILSIIIALVLIIFLIFGLVHGIKGFIYLAITTVVGLCLGILVAYLAGKKIFEFEKILKSIRLEEYLAQYGGLENVLWFLNTIIIFIVMTIIYIIGFFIFITIIAIMKKQQKRKQNEKEKQALDTNSLGISDLSMQKSQPKKRRISATSRIIGSVGCLAIAIPRVVYVSDIATLGLVHKNNTNHNILKSSIKILSFNQARSLSTITEAVASANNIISNFDNIKNGFKLITDQKLTSDGNYEFILTGYDIPGLNLNKLMNEKREVLNDNEVRKKIQNIKNKEDAIRVIDELSDKLALDEKEKQDIKKEIKNIDKYKEIANKTKHNEELSEEEKQTIEEFKKRYKDLFDNFNIDEFEGRDINASSFLLTNTISKSLPKIKLANEQSNIKNKEKKIEIVFYPWFTKNNNIKTKTENDPEQKINEQISNSLKIVFDEFKKVASDEILAPIFYNIVANLIQKIDFQSFNKLILSIDKQVDGFKKQFKNLGVNFNKTPITFSIAKNDNHKYTEKNINTENWVEFSLKDKIPTEYSHKFYELIIGKIKNTAAYEKMKHIQTKTIVESLFQSIFIF